MEKDVGKIKRVNGSLVVVEGLKGAKIGDVVHIGDLKLIGEVVRISEKEVALQCYEDTSGLRPGEHVVNTGSPLVAELGPGLIGGIFDGLERGELELWKLTGPFIKRGFSIAPLSRERRWAFVPRVKVGDDVEEGDILGVVQESSVIEHRILTPIGVRGVVEEIREGKFTVEEPVAKIKLPNGDVREVKMLQTWPVRIPRPYKQRLPLVEPLFTGQRVIDTFFPIAKGGTAAIPGGFGTGKCVTPDTPVLLSSGELIPIKDLFERYAGNIESEEALIPVENLMIYSFDGKEISPRKASFLYKGKSKLIVTIKTKSGRLLRVTPEHRLYKVRPDMKIAETPASLIKPGDRLAMPRQIPVKVHYQKIPSNILEDLKAGDAAMSLPRYVDENLAELFGLIFSGGVTFEDGRFLSRYKDLEERASKLFADIFGLRLDEIESVHELKARERILHQLFRKLGLALDGCLALSLVLRSPNSVVTAFLRGYYLGARSFCGEAIEISLPSKELVNQISYMLTRLGILYSIETKSSGYRLTIKELSEVRKFMERIGIREDLSKLGRHEAFSIQRSENLETTSAFAENIGASSLGQAYITLQRPSEEGPPSLSRLLRYVFFDEVMEVSVEEGDFTVYDLTVPETHNFVGGDAPTIFHNTITLHQIAKWSDANIIIYVGCGERGNEMADVITHFPSLEDPRTGKRLIERSVFIANVSNLPVSAREASVYMGVTLAEYFRDQGYDVAIMVDSTSRWAEAMRDISGRLEEIPAEAGYPAYLAERIAEFYERAGRVITLGRGHRVGSVTIMGAVSPPGGDFSEPVTSITLRFVGTLWALDTELAFRRHFPAINWLRSFSRYADLLTAFWSKHDPEWFKYRERALGLLEEASKIEEIARVIGEKALPDAQRLILLVSEIIREGFLVQSAFHEVDRYCPPEKQIKILKLIIDFYDLISPLIKAGVPVDKIREMKAVIELLRLKERKELEVVDRVRKQLEEEISGLKTQYELA